MNITAPSGIGLQSLVGNNKVTVVLSYHPGDDRILSSHWMQYNWNGPM